MSPYFTSWAADGKSILRCKITNKFSYTQVKVKKLSQ